MSAVNPPADPATIVILGASGDLTRRKLVPAVHSISCEGLLSPATQVIGLARSPLSDEEFQDHLYDGVVAYARLKPGLCARWPQFAKRISYLQGEYHHPDTYRQLAQHLNRLDARAGTSGNRLYYLALPPDLCPVAVERLGQAGLHKSSGWTRIIIEKPFGHDLQSARQLNDQVHAVFDESQVYRIDHYLGKETVQNLLVFRFANSIFEPLPLHLAAATAVLAMDARQHAQSKAHDADHQSAPEGGCEPGDMEPDAQLLGDLSRQPEHQAVHHQSEQAEG
jgi:glucose-6-phosphate 1-dehydrogenase